MNFLPYANLLEQVFVVLSGLVYLLPLQKREPIEVRFLSGLIMGAPSWLDQRWSCRRMVQQTFCLWP